MKKTTLSLVLFFLSLLSFSQTAPSGPALGNKIPIDTDRLYQMNSPTDATEALFDGRTDANIPISHGKVLRNYDTYYPLLEGEEMTIESVRFFDFTGTFRDTPVTLFVIDRNWNRIPFASFIGDEYNLWVGPYPARKGPNSFRLDAPVRGARYIVINSSGTYPTEIELYGSYTPPARPSNAPSPAVLARQRQVKLKHTFGVNAFEWNFQDGRVKGVIDERKMPAMRSFRGFRHYMDWEKLEENERSFTFNPTHSGSWNYDAVYAKCKTEGIEVLACLKTIPKWMQATYPAELRHSENVPARYGKDLNDPSSYIEQARVGFQYAGRYGSNKNVNPSLMSVNPISRWTNDPSNVVKIGLDLVKYIECENERDKWWLGRQGYQTAREYAANMSAFYDGHKNTMGPGIGIKNADPNMIVVMQGMAGPNTEYVKGMIDWCKQYRGYKPDGRVNLCWDVINYHYYTNDRNGSQTDRRTRGAAPEVGNAAEMALKFIKLANEQAYDMPVWITEVGYDLHPESPQKAIPIGNKSALLTQADWTLRTALLYARNGVERVYFYMLHDVADVGIQYSTSGLINGDGTRRPAADYLYQANKLFGEYSYRETIYADPIVDRYELNGKSAYILVVPDEKGRTADYTLNLGSATGAKIYTPRAGSENMTEQVVNTTNGKVTISVTETPVFVVAVEATTVTPPANQRPSVIITAPVMNAQFSSPATIGIRTTVTDADGTVAKVEFFAGANKIGEDTDGTNGWSYNWADVAAGTYELTVTATDNAGASTSATITVAVTRPAPPVTPPAPVTPPTPPAVVTPANQRPSVIITNPVMNARLPAPATMNIRATATDPDGTVAQVEFFAGTTKLGEDTEGGNGWSYSWRDVAAGTYELTVKATDNAGASASAAITVVVTQPVTPPAPPVAPVPSPSSEHVTAPQTPLPALPPAEIEEPVKRVFFEVYPNPFTNNAQVEFTLKESEEASLELYDTRGKLVRKLFKGVTEAGKTNVYNLQAAGLTPQMYTVHLVTKKAFYIQKVVLIN